MSLHYLVKLDMLISHMLPLSCYRKKLQNLSHLNCTPKFARFESSWLQRVGTVATEGVQNTHHWSGRTETATENGVGQAGSCRHCGSGGVISSRLVMRVSYTFSCNIYNMLLLTGFKSGETGGYSWGGINSGVSLCNNSMVACVWWAFQVSQGSVETLFRWGGKRLQDVAANLFRKRCTKFHQNCSSFMRYHKYTLISSFLDTLYISCSKC